MKRVLGLTDEVTTCECCGRTGLRSTVIVGTEEGEAYYGSTCASRFLGGSGSKRAGDALTVQAKQIGNKRQHAAEQIARLWEISESRYHNPQVWRDWVFANKHAITGAPIELLNNLINEYAKEL